MCSNTRTQEILSRLNNTRVLNGVHQKFLMCNEKINSTVL